MVVFKKNIYFELYMQKYFSIVKGMIFIVIFSIFTTITPAIAEISVSLNTDRTDATLSDTVKLVVRVQGKEGNPPFIIGLDHFQVSNGGSSSQFEMVNGRVSSEKEYIFYIKPRKKGIFIIGPAEVSHNNKIYKSNTIELKVDDTSPIESPDRDNPLFVTAECSNDHGYVGQIFLYILKFYRLKSVSNVSVDVPEIDGLSFKKLGEHKEYISTIKGDDYSVIELRYALIADKPGAYKITQAFFRMNVLEKQSRSNRGGFFDDSFFNITRTRPLSVYSNELDLIVKPLPKEGRSQDFSGLVGRFSIKASLAPKGIKVGESATLTTIISGDGNIRLIPDLKLQELKGIKAYDDQPLIDIQRTFNGVSGKKIMKWAIVPQKEGSYTIPAMSVSYFNPETGHYVQEKTSPLILEVTPGSLNGADNGSDQEISITTYARPGAKVYGEDIFSIHEGYDVLMPDNIDRTGAITLYIIFLSPAFIFFIILGIRYIYGKNIRINTLTAKKSIKVFLKNIKSLKNNAQTHDILKFINIYFNERFNLKGGSLTVSEIYNRLLQQGISQEAAKDILDIMTELEAMVYTGESVEVDLSFKENLITAIKKIDRKLR